MSKHTNVITTDQLYELMACTTAREWFIDTFPSETAPMVKVLKKSLSENIGWSRWYMEATATKKSAVALYNLAFEFAAEVFTKTYSNKPIVLAWYLKSLGKIKRGVRLDSIKSYDDRQLKSIFVLQRLEWARLSIKDNVWDEAAGSSCNAIRHCEIVLDTRGNTLMKKTIDFFDTFPISV